MAVIVVKIGQFLMNLEYNFFSSKVVKFTLKNHNRLNKKKNQVSDFFDFYFASYGHFSVSL